MKVNFSRNVTLNLFQGPFRLSGSGYAAQWMLEQVQHDGSLLEEAK
jgi:hypothetical protein